MISKDEIKSIISECTNSGVKKIKIEPDGSLEISFFRRDLGVTSGSEVELNSSNQDEEYLKLSDPYEYEKRQIQAQEEVNIANI